MTKEADPLPRWDLDVFFPGLASPEFEAEFASIVDDIGALERLYDQHAVGAANGDAGGIPDGDVFDAVLDGTNQLLERFETVQSFLYGLIATDSADDAAQAKWSELQQPQLRLELLSRRLVAWIGRLDVSGLLETSTAAAAHAYFLERAVEESEHLMAPELEALAASLRLSGSEAWSKLHRDVTSRLTVHVDLPDGGQELAMSAVRNLAYHADPDVRREAYRAELETWKAWRVPLAAAINSIKGEVNTLIDRRGWGTALDFALFNNHIDRQTLDAMETAVRDAFPHFRRYLKAKAGLLGADVLPWYDLYAPVGDEGPAWAFDEARRFIRDQFGGFSQRLQDLAERAFDEHWIDAEPRPGKRDGGFCMRVKGDQSRIMTNYSASYDGMSTIAHELGHAYHNLNLARRTMLQAYTPMTLAETASTFCQTIVQKAALKQLPDAAQLSILEAALQDQSAVTVDISSRLVFEEEVFDRRRDRELSADELCEIMLEAQLVTYGSGIDSESLHPYMWAVKPHYYRAENPFYNFPYTFGLLFGLGLFARYQADPQAFTERYDDLLSRTGMAAAADLASGFGIDLHDTGFWRSSLEVIREDIDRFETLAASRD
jgi:pepF/M3 family oligoendopeptidase